jgi:hypothetical protein
MKVNVVGFELGFGKNIDISEVYQRLESNQGKKKSIYQDKYVYYTDVKKDYIVGLIFRLRKDKSQIRTIEEDGDFKVDIDKLRKDHSSTEVSLFCLNPKTLQGVFYCYFGGLSTTILRTMWKPAHDSVQKAKIKDKTNEIKAHKHYETSKAKAEAEDIFHGFLKVTTLTTPATVNNLFGIFSNIKEIKINSKEALEGAGKYSPSSSFIRKGKLEATFENPNKWFESIKDYIRNIIPSEPNEGDIIRLVGETLTGEEKAYIVGENLKEFGQFSYDEYVNRLPKKKWSNYKKSKALKLLLKIMRNDSLVFGLPPEESTWRLPSATTENRKISND